MMRGLRLLALSLCIFIIVVYGATLEKRSTIRFGLLNSYKSLFNLDPDFLDGIRTQDELFEYIGEISKQSRVLQPLSSEYFVDDTGEMKIWSGVAKFRNPKILDVEGLEPIVDTPAFSIVAWIKLQGGRGANVIRKPLGNLPDEIKLSCWSWWVGAPADKVEFGAHDFRGTAWDSQPQETILSTAKDSFVSTDGQLHMVALVVNKTTISFYTDAKLQSAVPIRRPVTDCSGRALIIGDNDIPRFGEITFFPRELSVQEMVEIRSTGFTFESLAAGKLPAIFETTQFDTARAVQAAEFAQARGDRMSAEETLAIESALARSVTIAAHTPPSFVDPAKITVPNVEGCPVVTIFKATTSCHIMSNFTTYYTDTLTTGNKPYLPMIQPAYLPVGYHPTDRVLLDHLYHKEFLSYNATEWPSFCGQSATFSMWIENWDTEARATIFARYPEGTSKRRAGSWFLQLDADPKGTLVCVGQIPASESVAYWKCVTPPVRLNAMYRFSQRHLAMVLNHQQDTIQFYVDGDLVGTLLAGDSDGFPWIRDSLGSGVGRLDCKMNGTKGYTALGHRVAEGGEKPYRGAVQDWRYYVGQALTASEIKAIATKSVDKKGKKLRSCSFPTEGQDSVYKDIFGHSCSWYQKRVKKHPELCLLEFVRQACPVSCACLYGTPCRCFTAQATAPPKSYFIWDKVMPMREFDMNLGTNGDGICVREGLDAVAECRKNEANPQNFPVIGFTDYSPSTSTLDYAGTRKPTTRLTGQGNGRWCNIPPGPKDDVCNNIKVWDCDVLQKALNPSCSFRVDNGWTKKINSEIKQSGGYTLTFWWKAMDLTTWDSINKGQMVFFSSLVPPRVLFVLDFYGEGEGANINYWIEAYNTNGSTFENFNNIDGGQKFEIGTWYSVAVIFGAPDPAGENLKYLMLVAGANPAVIATTITGYMPDTEDFIQAITVPGGMMLTPIEITSKPMSISELQEYFYASESTMKNRRGAAASDEDRVDLEIEYSVPPAGFPFPMSLVAPPIILQTRRERTSNCTYATGSEYNNKVWETAIDVTCQPPYVCPDNFIAVPTSLMACSLPTAPERFFGKEMISAPGGKLMYFEFLQSIVDAPVLVRDNEPISTRAFIDAQTESVSCLMIGYSPQFGIVSTLSIFADLEADVRVDFEIKHYQSLEGDDLESYSTLVIVAFVFFAIVTVEKLVTIRRVEWQEARAGFFIDLLIQVVLPVIYFALRFPNIRDSKESMLQTLGVKGFAGVPWASREISLDDKVEKFLNCLSKLDSLNGNEKSMSIFYFTLSSLQLLRLIFQTSAHPRTAILIETLFGIKKV